LGKISEKIKGSFKTAVRVVRRFNADSSMITAGALSFYFLMSILPLSLLGLSVLGYVMGSKRAAVSAVTSLGRIGEIFPEGSVDVESILQALISGRGIFGGLGIIFLIWFSASVFYTVEVAVNKIFRTGKRRGFFHRTVIVYFFMLVAGGMLILSIAVPYVATIVSDFSLSLFGINPAEIPLLWNLLFSLVPPMLMMLMFTIIYRVGPTSKVGWGSAFKGGLAAGILWEISRRLFGWYISNLALYNKLYGALGTLVAIFVWLFYSSSIFLVGAEYAAVLNERREKKNARAGTDVDNNINFAE